MAKKVIFGAKPIEKQPANLDNWVATRSGEDSVIKEKIKRLTLDIPESLHRSIKGKAAIEGVAMVDMLRELLEEKYGNL
jgi:hypothetical protein